ncbi:MAG: glucosidase family protein [Acidimicrobiales bacterium]
MKPIDQSVAGSWRATALAPAGPAVLPEVEGVLDAKEVFATAQAIAEVQCDDGMIPWSTGGHCDPWNHVESAMALSVTGLHAEAARAYRWLADKQLPDGSWFNYYLAGSGVKDPRLDTNVCAYVATGVWHHYRITGDLGGLEEMWSTVVRALDFVLRWQRDDGAILWSVDPDGRPGRYPLLTGSSSIYHALRCAVAAAETLGFERPDWELAAGRLAHAIAHTPHVFEPKAEFAMDWYYPVLSGALEGQAAHDRIDAWWDTFVMEGLGVRCVSTGPWVTAAETAECALALDALGRREDARLLLTWAQAHRCEDGSYLTGLVYPEESTFPYEERTTYTAAAIVLAADALSDATPAAGLFRGESLPDGLDLTEPRRTAPPA